MSAGVDFRAMTGDDIAFAMQLKAQNHWNQLEADWQRQLALEPDGCFLAELAAQPVGTVCTCVFDDVAWINLVLVDQAHRGRGIGSALMQHVVRYLDQRGVRSIRLDATPLGQPVYEKLGFVGEYTLARYAGTMPRSTNTRPSAAGIEPLTARDLPAVLELDYAVTQTRREKLIRNLHEASPNAAWKYAVAGRLEGYCLTRPGSNAWQIGPIQGTPEAGRELLLDAGHRFAGQPVYLDVPTNHTEATTLAQSLGLTVQRPLLRMGRGQRVHENLAMFWSGFGPEKG